MWPWTIGSKRHKILIEIENSFDVILVSFVCGYACACVILECHILPVNTVVKHTDYYVTTTQCVCQKQVNKHAML